MTPRRSARQEPCGRVEATSRLAQADAYLVAARLVVDDASDVANPGVAGALAVLAAIAAADAACCARLASKDLQRLLDRKDTVHYGTTMITAAEGARMVGWAARLVGHAHVAVEA